MKYLLSIACVMAVTLPAQAISRYSSASMSCGQLQSAIDDAGAAIVTYTSKNPDAPPLYDRFVRSQQFCQTEEIARTKYVPTSDGQSCPLKGCIQYEKPDTNR